MPTAPSTEDGSDAENKIHILQDVTINEILSLTRRWQCIYSIRNKQRDDIMGNSPATKDDDDDNTDTHTHLPLLHRARDQMGLCSLLIFVYRV